MAAPNSSGAGAAELIQLVEDMGGDEYESLPESSNPAIHALAGSVAGIAEHTLMFPLDVVKTRLHRLQPAAGAQYTGVSQAFRSMVRHEGSGSLFRGFTAVAVGAGPAHALYFASYEQSKHVLGISTNPAAHPYATAAAGAVAAFSHEATMNPIEVIKQRMQMHGSSARYRTPWQCARKVLATEGLIAFYRSFPTQVVMSVPYQCVHLVTYEFLRDKLNPEKKYHPMTHLLAGAGAGSTAAVITNPFDVTKTLLNTQEPVFEKRKMSGLLPAFQTIYRTNGWRGFFKGISARVGIAAPGTAISWGVYEGFKHVLGATDLDSSSCCSNHA